MTPLHTRFSVFQLVNLVNSAHNGNPDTDMSFKMQIYSPQ